MDIQPNAPEEEEKGAEINAEDATSVPAWTSVATHRMQAAAAASMPRGVGEQGEWSRDTTEHLSDLRTPPVKGGAQETLSRRNVSYGDDRDGSSYRTSRCRRVRGAHTNRVEGASSATGRSVRGGVPQSPSLPRELPRISAAQRFEPFVRQGVVFESPVGTERERKGQERGVDGALMTPTTRRFGGGGADGGTVPDALSSVERFRGKGAGVSPTEMNSDGSGGEGEDSMRESLSNAPPSDRYIPGQVPGHGCTRGCAGIGVQRSLRLQEEGYDDDDHFRLGFDLEGGESGME